MPRGHDRNCFPKMYNSFCCPTLCTILIIANISSVKIGLLLGLAALADAANPAITSAVVYILSMKYYQHSHM